MRRSTTVLLFALAASASGVSAANLTPSQVLYNTNQLNGQKISVIGVVSSLKAGTSADGTSYQSFKLCDANACLSVVSTAKDTYTEGKQLTAEGVFWAVWHQGTVAHFNELVLQ